MITITSNALTKIREILSEEDEGSKLRTFVQGGGCAGFEYGFSVDKEQNEDDFEIEGTDGLVLIDAMSMQYLNDAVIDYVEDLMGASFRIENPNAQTTCGCGSSFSMSDDFFYDNHGVEF